MVRYNVENATDAFAGLAESLDAVSRLPLSCGTWESNTDMKRDIANIIDLCPDADRIRAPYERAIEIANTARDEGTATALRKLLADLLTAHEKLTRGEKTESEYKAQLADVAASVRGLLADIAEDGTKRTDTAQPPEKVTVELAPKQAALLEKAADHSAAERAADKAGKTQEAVERVEAKVEEAQETAERAADNSQATVGEMCEWRGFIKQLIAGYDGEGLTPSPLTANKQQAIYEMWDGYTTDCKCKHTRPTYEGCLDEHAGDNIYKGHTLIELVQNAQGLERVVHNVKEQARRK